MCPESWSLQRELILDMIESKIKSIDPDGNRQGMAMCRRINLETVADLNMSGLVDEAMALIDPNYPHIQGYTNGEHVIGVALSNEKYVGFDGTVQQLDFEFDRDFMIWEADSFPELIHNITEDIGGEWNKQLVTSDSWIVVGECY